MIPKQTVTPPVHKNTTQSPVSTCTGRQQSADTRQEHMGCFTTEIPSFASRKVKATCGCECGSAGTKLPPVSPCMVRTGLSWEVLSLAMSKGAECKLLYKERSLGLSLSIER